MSESQDKETVFICYEWKESHRSHYHATGDWVVAGVVEEKQDAGLWAEPDGEEEHRKYTETMLNNVQAWYTSALDSDLY